MQEENREKRIEEPQEVVNWYVRPNDREVVDCYVQPRPMPVGAAPVQPPAAPKKAGKKGLRIFLIAVGVLLAAIVREGRTIIPGGMTVIRAGDHVLVVTNAMGLTDLKDILA